MTDNKKNTQSNFRNNEKENYESLVKRIESTKRLSDADRRIFAINMGKISEEIDSVNPKQAVKMIINESKLSGVLEKRKRFFRLPGEEAPESETSKDGEYATNPIHFRKLAEAAGRLGCRSKREEIVIQASQSAVIKMALGTSLLPTYSPKNTTDLSLKALLEEYATRIEEKIENETDIISLWQALETSPIDLKPLFGEEDPDGHKSIYEEDAEFPSKLLQPMYKPHVTKAYLEPLAQTQSSKLEWSQPTLEIGTIKAYYKVSLFRIPQEKHEIFSTPSSVIQDTGDRNMINLSTAGSEWLWDIGVNFDDCFDVLSRDKFPNLDFENDGIGFDTFYVPFWYKVGLKIKCGVTGKVELELRVWNTSNSNNISITQLNKNSEQQAITKFNDAEKIELYKLYVDLPNGNGKCLDDTPNEDGKFLDDIPFVILDIATDYELDGPGKTIAIMPSYWQENPDFSDDFEAEEEFHGIKCANGWINDPYIAKLLLGAENILFYPSIPQSESVAGSARSGSISASLLHNSKFADDKNRITELLIKKAELTANTGLNFLKVMIEKDYEGIRRI